MKVSDLIVRAVDAALVRPLDQFVRETRNILNGGVKLRDQLSAEIKQVRYTGGESLTVRSKYATPPIALWALNAREAATGTATFISGGAVTWAFSGTQAGDSFIEITAIDGLTASTDYLVTLAIVES
jgi:hypothetical protein